MLPQVPHLDEVLSPAVSMVSAKWAELLAADVDQIIADDLPRLRDFLLWHEN